MPPPYCIAQSAQVPLRMPFKTDTLHRIVHRVSCVKADFSFSLHSLTSTYGEQRQERTKRRKREREENRGSAFRPGSNVASLLLFLPSSFFPEIARGERRGRERENTEVFSLFLLLLLASLYGSSSPYSYAEENLLRVWGGGVQEEKKRRC